MDGSVDWIELKIPVQGVKGRRLLFCLPVFFFRALQNDAAAIRIKVRNDGTFRLF